MVTMSEESDSGFSGGKGITLYVGGTGSGNYSTIQSAINDASDGDIVYVYNGTYYGKLIIGKTINLVGEDKYTTILDGDSDYDDIILIDNPFVNISGFTITNSGRCGIMFSSENKPHIFNNIFKNNVLSGLYISKSTNISIENNTFINDGILMVVEEREDLSNYTIHNNTVNNKPLRFYHDMNNFSVPSDTGAVILGNCTNVTIHQINLTHSSAGILISYSSNITITSNTIIYNRAGIYLETSSDVYIHQNTLSHNLNGLYFYRESNQIFIDNNEIKSSNSTGIVMESNLEHDYEIYITNNTIYDNQGGISFYTLVWCNVYIKNNIITANNNFGIYLGYMSTNAMIIGNIITHNIKGIITSMNSDGKCYHNEFFGNTNNVFENGKFTGDWDNGYPSGGNYWDDYEGVDFYHGENQDIPGGDGIGDTPYQISVDHVDNYPFMAPFGMKIISGLQEQWNLVSLPFNKTVDKTKLQYYFNDTFYSWERATTDNNPTGQPLINPYYFDWNRNNQTYQFTSTLRGGYGYWFFAFEPGTFWIEYQNDTVDNMITILSPGWNLFSIPYNFALNKIEIVVNDTDWYNAVTTGLISDYIFGWDRISQSYFFTDTFEPGEAYWIYAYQECVLKRQMYLLFI